MEIPYTVTARPDTGLWNAKIGIWLFLASEVMLFGGLFSGYVFLRMGVGDLDNPWPTRQLPVLPGFINTLVLIVSSVFVVFAWAELKMRNYARYQWWMRGVLVCALAFLVIKGYEYYGKFTHAGIKLTDNTVFEGKLISDKIKFKATSLTVDPRQTRLNILDGLEEGTPEFTTPDGEKVMLNTAWLRSFRLEAENNLVAARQAERKAAAAEGREPNLPTQPERMTLTAVEPLIFSFKPRRVRNYSDKKVLYQDQHSVEGELIDDKIVFEVHDVNLQSVSDQENAMAWRFVDDGIKNAFFEHQAEVQARADELNVTPDAFELNMLKHVHGHAKDPTHHGEKAAPKPETGGETETASPGGDHSGYPQIVVPRIMKQFLSAHGPGYSTYYSIYFTMTALHGLHVIGGALVLAYFLFFNKKLYKQNPEHLANRVEVGGLFWHFVDLVWIFLFPVMYLM
jgi:heme/copper-type cytochrome/quinol oxidase subunit 3